MNCKCCNNVFYVWPASCGKVYNKAGLIGGKEEKRVKRIFFIICTLSCGGGSEALLTTIVNHLNPDKYEVGIMEILHDTVKQEPINQNIKIYPYYIKADDPERKAKMYYVYHEWDKVIDEYIPDDYDLYVSFNYLRPSFLLPPGKKNIAWIHGDVYDLAEEKFAEERRLQSEAFDKADRIIAISDITEQSLYDLFPEHREKVRVIYNGVDEIGARIKAKEACEIKLLHPAILSIGRLDTNKNPLRLLNIFEKLHDKMPNVHLYYLGDGVLREEIVRKTKEKNLENLVHLLGYHDNPFPIIAQCDVSCMFSHSEGFPMALLESVALGKSFVSSIVGGARILADNFRCGNAVETDEEAVEAIIQFLGEDHKTMEGYCAEAIERFTLQRYIGQIENLFDEVMEE